jgi:preprotein translocase subunit YajC
METYLLAAFLQAKDSGGALGWGLLPLILIFAIFYFLLIMPQQRRQKKWQHMLGELKAGDKVVTSGGIHGTIISLRDDALQLRVPPDNLRLEISRSAIVSLANPEEGGKS